MRAASPPNHPASSDRQPSHRFKRTRSARWAIALCLLILGCDVDTRVEYRHEPTADVEAAPKSLTLAKWAPFTVEGVVAAPLLRPLTVRGTQVWLTLWAADDKTVSVRAARLSGVGSRAAESLQVGKERTVAVNDKAANGTRQGVVLLGELDNDALASLVSAGGATLTLELRVSPAPGYRPLSFALTRRTTRHWATH